MDAVQGFSFTSLLYRYFHFRLNVSLDNVILKKLLIIAGEHETYLIIAFNSIPLPKFYSGIKFIIIWFVGFN